MPCPGGRGVPRHRLPRGGPAGEADAMTLATYVETPSPHRTADDGAVDLLPAELTVAFGAATHPVPAPPPLSEFLKTAGTLTLDERLVLFGQALVLLEQNYVHLPLKSA